MSILKTSAAISVLSLIGSLLAFGAQLSIARSFGAGPATDAYFAGFSLPLLFGGLLAGGIGYNLVPLLVRSEGRSCPERYRSALVCVTIIGSSLILIIAAVVLYVLRDWWPAWSRFSHEGIRLITGAAWASACLNIVSAAFGALLQARGCYVRAAMAACCPPASIIMACFLFKNSEVGIVAVSVAAAVGQGATAVALVCSLDRGSLYCPKIRELAIAARDLRYAPAVVLSMAVFSAFGAIDAYFGLNYPEGTLAVLAFGQRLLIAVAGIVVTGISAVVLTQFSQLAAAADRTALGQQVTVTARLVTICVTILAGILGTLSMPLISSIYRGGKFSSDDVQQLSRLLPFLSVGMVPMSVCTVMFRALYALQDLMGAAAIGSGGALLYWGLCFSITERIGSIHAFGIAYCITWIVVAYVSTARMATKVGGAAVQLFSIKWLLKLGVCGIAAAGAMRTAVFISAQITGGAASTSANIILAAIGGCIGAAVFVTVAGRMKLSGIEPLLETGITVLTTRIFKGTR